MNYENTKIHCENNSQINREAIDDYLMYYAAEKEGLDKVMDYQLKKYRHIARNLEPAHVNYLKAEYITHRIFRKNGYINNYLKKHVVQSLPENQRRLLEYYAAHPWRYSFGTILDQPFPEFFNMEDILTGDQYLLYSPGMQLTENEHHPISWLILIGFNGQCWQTYGLIIPLKSFDLDNIFFFASEKNSDIENSEMLQADLENDPWPYFMLLNYALTPVVDARGFELRQYVSVDTIESFSTAALGNKFKVEWDQNIYKIRLLKKDHFPHFAQAFYNEENNELTRTALTDYGFKALTAALKKAGYELSPEADISVSPSMINATGEILNKEVHLHPYEDLFDESDPEADDKLESLNHFMQLALPYINSGETPDIKALAAEAGVDYETALDFYTKSVKHIEKLKKKMK